MNKKFRNCNEKEADEIPETRKWHRNIKMYIKVSRFDARRVETVKELPIYERIILKLILGN
jgi:hypothetical protein